jgi:hypothetical protein
MEVRSRCEVELFCVQVRREGERMDRIVEVVRWRRKVKGRRWVDCMLGLGSN